MGNGSPTDFPEEFKPKLNFDSGPRLMREPKVEWDDGSTRGGTGFSENNEVLSRSVGTYFKHNNQQENDSEK